MQSLYVFRILEKSVEKAKTDSDKGISLRKIHDIFILPFYTKNGFCDNIDIVCIYGK